MASMTSYHVESEGRGKTRKLSFTWTPPAWDHKIIVLPGHQGGETLAATLGEMLMKLFTLAPTLWQGEEDEEVEKGIFFMCEEQEAALAVLPPLEALVLYLLMNHLPEASPEDLTRLIRHAQERLPEVLPAYEKFFAEGLWPPFPPLMPLLGALTPEEGREVNCSPYSLQGDDYELFRTRETWEEVKETMRAFLGKASWFWSWFSHTEDDDLIHLRHSLPWRNREFMDFLMAASPEDLAALRPLITWQKSFQYLPSETHLPLVKTYLAVPPLPPLSVAEGHLQDVILSRLRVVDLYRSSLLQKSWEHWLQATPPCNLSQVVDFARIHKVFPTALAAPALEARLLEAVGEEAALTLLGEIRDQAVTLSWQEWESLLEVLETSGPQPWEWLALYLQAS